MSRWLLALLLAAAGWPTAGAHDALDAIDGCLRELDPGLDVGYQRIAARCPDLTPTLVQSQYAAWLPRDWNQTGNLLSADGLTELRALLTREPAATAARGAPSVEHVAALLAKVTQSEQPRAGWWTRLKQWLREVLAPRPERAGESWWRRLIGDARLSDVALEAVGWGAMLLVIALAVVVVINELRVAGVLKARERAHGRARTPAAGPGALTLEDLERVSPLEQPSLLLELIARRLVAQERLPPARSLTVHELTRAARLPGVSDRERFDAVAKRRDLARDGNLLIVTLPVATPWQAQESRALDEWIRAGNTLLALAALSDRPDWSQGGLSVHNDLQRLTGLDFEPAHTGGGPHEPESPEAAAARLIEASRELAKPQPGTLVPNRPHPYLRGVSRVLAWSDYAAQPWSVRLPRDGFVLSLAHQAETGEGVLWTRLLGEGTLIAR